MADSGQQPDLCADLVLEGGGVKGIALVGALSVLEDRGYRFSRVGGTSAGAIVGALTAARMPTATMAEIMETLDYRRFQDASALSRLGGPGQLLALLTSNGIYRGDYLREWLAEKLADRQVRTFGNLRGDDPNTSLPPEQDYRLVVMVSDVTQGALRRLPWDYHRYGCNADEVAVVDAVRASMSIPFFYRPVKLKDRRTGRQCWLVDGGMLSNFPVECFDRRDAQRPRWPTFGIKLSDRPSDEAAAFDVRGVLSLTRAMVGTMTSFHDRLHLESKEAVDRTIFIDTKGVRSTDFSLDRPTQRRLFESGQKAAEKFLDGGPGREPWSFDAYLERHRGGAAPPPAADEGAPPAGAAAGRVARRASNGPA
ncbi:MAG TPA: patatin-like phospholipase family protein [Egibacteraceae bacterium]|jgi:NTE family protein|nr:patatin-like phospholipase family protein [Egibacteraceae bacterium]